MRSFAFNPDARLRWALAKPPGSYVPTANRLCPSTGLVASGSLFPSISPITVASPPRQVPCTDKSELPLCADSPGLSTRCFTPTRIQYP